MEIYNLNICPPPRKKYYSTSIGFFLSWLSPFFQKLKTIILLPVVEKFNANILSDIADKPSVSISSPIFLGFWLFSNANNGQLALAGKQS